MNNKITEKNFEDIQFSENFEKRYFPYLTTGQRTFLGNLQFTAENCKNNINRILLQILKDYSGYRNQQNEFIEGMNHIFQNELKNKKIEPFNSLLLHRYWEYEMKSVFIILLLICSSSYNTSIREMRFVLESFIHAFCIDKEFPSLSLKEKLQKLELIGKEKNWKIKKNLFLANFGKFTEQEKAQEYYSFYTKDLSELVHASYGELVNLREQIFDMREEHGFMGITSVFNKERLNESLKLFSKLHKFLIEILNLY